LRGEIKSKFIQIVSAGEANLDVFFSTAKERMLDEIIFEDSRKGYEYIKRETAWLSGKIKNQYTKLFNMIYKAAGEIFNGATDIDLSKRKDFLKSVKNKKEKKAPVSFDDFPRRIGEWLVFLLGLLVYAGILILTIMIFERTLFIVIGINLSVFIGIAVCFLLYRVFENVNRNKLRDYINSKINSLSSSTKKNMNKIINDFENDLVKLIEEESK